MNDNCRILLIDDDEEDYIITKHLLRSIPGKKCEVQWAVSFDEATPFLDQSDIFLVDYRLGAENGLDIIKKIKQINGEVPVILLTGLSDKHIDEEALKAGAYDYLVKGKIDAEQLERTIRYALEHANHLREIKQLNTALEKRVTERTSQLTKAIEELEQANELLARQIEENKKAREELEYREFLLRETQRVGKSGGFVWNIHDNSVDYGHVFTELIETTPGTLANTLDGLKSIIHEDDIKKFNQFCEQAKHAQKIEPIELRYVLPNKKLKYVYHEGKIYSNLSDKSSYLIGFTQDISQRKIAEQELFKSQRMLEALAKNYPNGVICLYDKFLRCEFIEGKELETLKLGKIDFLGKTVFETFRDDTAGIHDEYFRRTLLGENAVYEVIYADNNYLIHTTPLRDNLNQIERIVVVMLNITHIKMAEEQIRQALDKATELSDMKSRFISMASHEFRTPLSTILSSVNLMSRYFESADEIKFKKHTVKIKSAITNLTEILEYFLSVEKLDAGHFHINPEMFEMVAFINQHIYDVEDIKKPTQTITFESNVNEAEVYFDKKIIRAILQNLISNALKYSFDNGVILITFNLNLHNFEIQVKDSGIGIPQEEQRHLFERFYRAKNVSNIEGTGIGLNMIKRYIDLCNGKIQFTSETNNGTTFTVTLPREQLVTKNN